MRSVKTRNVTRTREAILHAARVCFAEKGYGQVGVREIARVAGFNSSLVNRYFGSKFQLFSEAVLGSSFADDRGLSVLASLRALVSDPTDLPTREREVLTAILRSAASDEARAMIIHFLEVRAVKPLSVTFEVADAEARAGCTLAFAFGVQMLRDVLRAPSLADFDAARMSRLFDVVVDAIIDADLSTPTST